MIKALHLNEVGSSHPDDITCTEEAVMCQPETGCLRIIWSRICQAGQVVHCCLLEGGQSVPTKVGMF